MLKTPFHRDHLHTFIRVVAIHHHLVLGTQLFFDNRSKAALQRRLKYDELVGRDRTLYDHLAQTIRAVDHHRVPEAGLRIQGEGNTRYTKIATHHLLYTDGKTYFEMIEVE